MVRAPASHETLADIRLGAGVARGPGRGTQWLRNLLTNESNADKASPEPDEENLGLQIGISLAVVDEIRCRIGDCPVEQPLD